MTTGSSGGGKRLRHEHSGPRGVRTQRDNQEIRMTRIDMTTREWHELIKPVLPHAGNDPENPQLAPARSEAAGPAFSPVPPPRYPPGPGGHRPPPGLRRRAAPAPAHTPLAEPAASLKLSPSSKDAAPPLR